MFYEGEAEARPEKIDETFCGCIDYGDVAAQRIMLSLVQHEHFATDLCDGDITHICGHPIAAIEREMWTRVDFPGVGNNGRKCMPMVPALSESDRGVEETELRTFTT